MEISIVNQIIDEIEIELIEIRHITNVKLRRLANWRKIKNGEIAAWKSKEVKDAHAILGISAPRNGENPVPEIKKMFKLRARECHPDLVADKEDEFKEITDAYEKLIEYYEAKTKTKTVQPR